MVKTGKVNLHVHAPLRLETPGTPHPQLEKDQPLLLFVSHDWCLQCEQLQPTTGLRFASVACWSPGNHLASGNHLSNRATSSLVAFEACE